MIGGIHVTLSGEPPMPPEDADFSVTIDFKKGEGNPRRIFDAASLLIEGFERLDQTAIISIDASIEPLLVLEDVERGSLKIFLKNVLKSADDQAIKSLDWKPQVGKYLVRAKYAALKWLDDAEDGQQPDLKLLSAKLREIASETDVRHLPDYAPVHEAKLLSALDKMQDGKRQLESGDRLYIDTDDGKRYEVDLTQTWSPTATVSPESQRETHTHGELILTVRKPDMIGDTQWQFRHGKTYVSAPINDIPWMDRYRSRGIDIRPGDALRCWAKFVFVYDATGNLEDQTTEIEKVFEVIRGPGPQGKLDV